MFPLQFREYPCRPMRPIRFLAPCSEIHTPRSAKGIGRNTVDVILCRAAPARVFDSACQCYNRVVQSEGAEGVGVVNDIVFGRVPLLETR